MQYAIKVLRSLLTVKQADLLVVERNYKTSTTIELKKNHADVLRIRMEICDLKRVIAHCSE